jgi:PAS domain S-box-containing protein
MFGKTLPDWAETIPVAITVCDLDGIIVYMNQKSIDTFEKYGGEALIGKSLVDCHPEPSRSKLLNLLKTGETNTYTIEKNGKRKMICQVPWFSNGSLAGLAEFSIQLPGEMPHFIRS